MAVTAGVDLNWSRSRSQCCLLYGEKRSEVISRRSIPILERKGNRPRQWRTCLVLCLVVCIKRTKFTFPLSSYPVYRPRRNGGAARRSGPNHSRMVKGSRCSPNWSSQTADCFIWYSHACMTVGSTCSAFVPYVCVCVCVCTKRESVCFKHGECM